MMEERRFVEIRKNEFNIREYVKQMFGKGKVAGIRIEYTPVGEKIIVSTHRPGWIIGKKGEKIANLTEILKKRFKMENPHIDIAEVKNPDLDARIVADNIALSLERFGSLKYKPTSYRALSRIKEAGALGAEIRVSGKLPSDRARVWRFHFGYLKKTGDSSKVVDRAEAVAKTKQGVVGIKVSILPPDAEIHDEIVFNESLIEEIEKNAKLQDDGIKTEIKNGKKKK